MATVQSELYGNFDNILNDLDDAVMKGSFSASKEGEADFILDECQCAVRVYERYSMMGGNRVSLNITLLLAGGRIKFSAITSGGSQAVFFKMNTMGEEAFLDVIRDTIRNYQ